MLDARVDAVRRGDRDAFLATVDPAAPAAFRLAQAASFDGLRSLPLASYSLTARLDDTGDLGAGLSPRYGGAPTFLPETRLRMRFADYDDRDDVESLFLTFVQRGDRWYVAGDADLAPLGIDSFRGLWDQGPVEVQRTAALPRAQPPARSGAGARTWPPSPRRPSATLDERWDEPWSHRVPLILPGSIDELALDPAGDVRPRQLRRLRRLRLRPRPRLGGRRRPASTSRTATSAATRATYQVRTLTHELEPRRRSRPSRAR